MSGHTDDYDHCLPWHRELAGITPHTPAWEWLRDRLVTEYLPVAEHIARRFRGRGQPHDDLVQVARLGLVQAVDRFDVARDNDFLVYAVPTITGEIRRYFRDSGWAVRVSRRMKELSGAITRANAVLTQSLGRAATAQELAHELGVDPDEVHRALVARTAYDTVSIDQPLPRGREPASIATVLGAPDTDLAAVDDRETLRSLIDRLPTQERQVLIMRFFGNCTQTQIAEQIGSSQMQVSRILQRTLTRLRHRLIDD